ncbi:MAG: C1 family peptidase, partial [Anaerolineae bacterium]
MGLCLVVVLILVAGLAPGGVLWANQGPELQEAPTRPVPLAPHPPGTGFVPPAMDLSHLTGQTLPRGVQPQALPDVFDWRDSGKVTPVKDQGNCGSCYAFSFLGNFESRLLIDGAGTWDLSENHAKECNWEEVYGSGSSCSGGNFFMVADLYSQTGSVLESCNPYVPSDVGCSLTCPYQQSVLDFRLISGNPVPSPAVLKQYIYDHGPVATTVYVDDDPLGFSGSYDGSTTMNYTAPAGETNHGVVIVGWSNNLPPVPGGSMPADGWIVKNSWGTGWGDGGYFYITYGSGNIGAYSAFVQDWQLYDSAGDLWYYDEAGWSTSYGTGSSTTCSGLAKYIPGSNTNVTHVEFWTNDVTSDVDVYLYDSFDGTSPSNPLATKLDNSFAEAGYHSVALDSPVLVTAGNDVIAVVKFTNSAYTYPIAVDRDGPTETGRTYISATGNPGTWVDLSNYGVDATIRLRTTAGSTPPAPAVTSITPNSAPNTGTVHITSLAGSSFLPGATAKLAR